MRRREFLKIVAGTLLAASFPRRLAAFAQDIPPEAIAADMLTRTIPASGEKVPALGLGTWQTFDVGPAEEQRAPLREVLRLFFKAGGQVIDSSPMYGRSEAVIGELTKELGREDRAFFATKVWTPGKQRGITQMRASFQKFGVRQMDLMQIHNLVDWQTHMRTLKDWKEENKIRYTGITHYLPSAFDALENIMKTEKPDFVQLPYSIQTRGAENHLLPLAQELGIAVLVNRPFEQGALFRKVRNQPLPDWASEFGCESWAQFFLKFILAHPAVTCVIPATSNPRHLVDNMRAGTSLLPSKTQQQAMIDFFEAL